MRRIVLWFMSTLTAVVLLFGYHTSTSGPDATVAAPGSASGFGAGQTSTGSGSSTSSDTGSASGSGSGSSSARSVDGPVINTRWGPVQVRITTDGSTLTGVEVLQYPTGNGKDQEINDYALPILVSETMDAKSAGIDMVSGATVTSEGYLQSLQAALDGAGL
jgi:uncharacterized protein with FMN-binding domain